MERANRMKFCEKGSDWFTLLFEIDIADSFTNRSSLLDSSFIAQVKVFVVTEDDVQKHVSEGRGPGLVSAGLQSVFSLSSNEPVITVINKVTHPFQL